MRSLADEVLRFASDDDLLSLEGKIDDGGGNGVWPRTDKFGNPLRSWDKYHQKGMNELSRRLRSRKDTAEPLELGRLDPRSRARLRDPAAAFALHYLFLDADNSGDTAGWMATRAGYWWRMGGDWIDAEVLQLDYDSDDDGTTSESEKNQPFPTRFIRG